MNDIRFVEVTYENFAEHEPLRRAIIEVRDRHGQAARNTVLCVTVKKPCVQMGEFQDIDEELNLEACEALGVNVARRVGGGGCLYYDDQTRFAVALLDRGSFVNLEEAARVWQGEVVTGTLRDLGAKEAWYRHIGDVQIGQTKISGLGTALIQNTLYLGSFMNIGTPRVELAQKVLKIPPEKFADKSVSGLDDYVTSVAKVTGRMPSAEEIRGALTKNLERALGARVTPGEISPEEKEVFEKLRPVYTSDGWIAQRSSRRRFQDLPPGTGMGKHRRKARKLVIAHVSVDEKGKIHRVMLCGDFFIQPGSALEEIEKGLQGVEAGNEEGIVGVVKETLSRLNAQTPMLTVEDFALPITRAALQALEVK